MSNTTLLLLLATFLQNHPTHSTLSSSASILPNCGRVSTPQMLLIEAYLPAVAVKGMSDSGARGTDGATSVDPAHAAWHAMFTLR